MAWQLTGKLIEACSCKSICPCVLGPAEPDRGWCSGALTFVIENGNSDEVDLSRRTVVWLIDLPKDFASGDGTVRIYIDDKANERQRQELEAIFSGKKGGPGAVLGSLVSKWLPAKTAGVSITDGENPSVAVTGVGYVTLQRTKDQSGRTTTLLNAPVLGLIEIEKAEIARGDGSRISAPEMRTWDSGGHGTVGAFSWAA